MKLLNQPAALALALAAACVDAPSDTADVATAASPVNGHVDLVRVHAILTANDDGSQAATASPADIQAGIAEARAILAAAGLELTFDPESDVTRINSTVLNYDCTAIPGADLSNHSIEPQDCDINSNERDRIALGFPGKLVLYFSSGDRFTWSDTANMWVYGPHNFDWSNHFNHFVAMMQWDTSGQRIAHEMGHYLHLDHSFGYQPSSLKEASELIVNYVQSNGLPISAGANAFDGDGIADTPPDPGPALFIAAGLDPCNAADSQVQIPVNFPNSISATYTLAPDRENIMNYWDKTCRGSPPHLSNGQVALIRDAVENGNRSHLIAPKVLYSAVWEPGDRGQTRAIGWAFNDFLNRMSQELAAGRHLVHMQAYDVGAGDDGGNPIRWDGVWEPGGTNQSWVVGWAWNDIVKQHLSELAAGRRLLHMQAYDLGGGQIRWDAVWEPGTVNQGSVMGYAQSDVATVFNQYIAAGYHFVHMQAYDIGEGEIRWDAVWEPGARGTTRAIGWAMGDFAQRFNAEIAAGKHCVHMQAYDIGGGQIRWDGVWEDGVRDTSRAIGWAFNDFTARLAQETAAGRGLVHMQAYDIGDGQIRYDGVWEAGVPSQHRLLSETISPFANRFNAETATGMHVTLMQAHAGR